ncbi:3-hydroxyacyl-ACP dehydratase FabZ [Fictibacillus sp. WQ 8-8]|uniref:3-hydroxyacyl-[acyl-carrier-protein] dehydratase FabZ n=1 Tax=Fictibacillus terranigra TaxID=3058424 RepID=A0ABT8E151_9BACL|nr:MULTISPECIES: 3-hydroxyacyl-ACP dehydratase FabZ [unclassified Fictibacillus]MCQ6264863.1 3-hydroxyacyl-ACP dehydratase FabZ [Fictibacillus sp. WQ 8-8]MDN4071626.1 3-hydroxyacyl-ACP dehydratase FabZ [Fictibacillus sp. CENA-BCM004]MED2970837.1 3-hydroxyacyl-ACP dehydratase FabZ [Fictibacillus sp. B-59209]SFE86535.1 3-hydroxyacyl-[acyl-carrier-protein] dehydratase [Bacillus sp. OV194]
MKLNIEQIKEIIPHRYPFLLLDTIEELEPGKRAVGKKNITANEEVFNGHFPDYNIFPGVLTLEACAQTGAVALLSLDEYKGKIAMFAGADKVRWKRQVRPGDTLLMEVELLQIRRGIGKGKVTATVDGELAMDAEITFAVGR